MKPVARPYPDEAAARHLIIGIGNEYRGDDAAGIAVARKLGSMNLSSWSVIEAAGDGAGLIELWKHKDYVILVDATVSGSLPGAVTRVDLLNCDVLPESLRFSSHALGLAGAIELARTLHQLPSHAILYGIEGHRFDHGVEMSKAVADSVETVVSQIANEISLN